MNEKDVFSALKEIRENSKKRKFEESIDLAINLKDFDIKKESVDIFVSLPNKTKEKKICFFLETDPSIKGIDVITKSQISSYDKRKAKSLAKKYDYFVSISPLMPSIATTFGKIFGPRGKMPSPAAGSIIPKADVKLLEETSEKLQKIVRMKTRGERTIKITIGKENIGDKEITENFMAAFNSIIAALPKGDKNIKSMQLKFSMGEPVKIKI